MSRERALNFDHKRGIQGSNQRSTSHDFKIWIFKIWVINKSFLLIYFSVRKFFQAMVLWVQFDFNLCFIIHQKANHHSNSVLQKLRKLMDLRRATSENMCVIKKPSFCQNFCLRGKHEVSVYVFYVFATFLRN